MLNSCIKEPQVNLGLLTMKSPPGKGNSNTEIESARLDFIQNMEYKFVELLYCSCYKSPDDVVQQHITYRYNNMKQKVVLLQVIIVKIILICME